MRQDTPAPEQDKKEADQAEEKGEQTEATDKEEAKEEDKPEEGDKAEGEPEEEEKQGASPSKKTGPMDLLERLFAFLSEPAPINPVLAGYFSKLINIFINKKAKDIFGYMFSHPELLEKMVVHTYSKSISEVLIKFLTYDEPEGEENDIPAQKNRLLSLLIDKLGPEETEEDNLNSQDLLVELTDTKSHLAHMMARENLLKIIGFLHSDKQSSQIAALTLLNSIAGHCKGLLAKKTDEDAKQEGEGEETHDSGAESMVALLTQELQFVVKLLQVNPPPPENDTATYGYPIRPFGLLRLRVVEFLSSVVRLQSQELLDVLRKNGVFRTLLGFLKNFPWNNILHMKINAIFEDIFGNSDARALVVTESGMLELLIEMGGEAEFAYPSTLKQRHGYMPFVISLSNQIQKLDDMKEAREGQEGWDTYANHQLKLSNTLNNRSLGGHQPKNPFGQEEEQEESSFELNMEKLFARFQNYQTQYNTSGNSEEDQVEEEQDDNAFERDGEARPGGLDSEQLEAVRRETEESEK